MTARPRPDGTVQLAAAVPAAGSVAVTVRERPTVRRAGRRAAPTKRVTPDATGVAPQPGRVRLSLAPVRRLSRQLRRAGGVPATITVRFTPSAGGAPLTKTLAVTFRRTAATTARKATR